MVMVLMLLLLMMMMIMRQNSNSRKGKLWQSTSDDSAIGTQITVTESEAVDKKQKKKPKKVQQSACEIKKFTAEDLNTDTKRTVAKRLTRQRTRKDAKLEQSENEIDNQAKEDVNDSIDMDIWDELKSKQIDNQDSCETNTLVKHDDNPVKKDIAAETKIESVMKDGTVDDVETGGLQELEAEDLNTQGNTEGTKRIKKRGKQYTTVTNEDGHNHLRQHLSRHLGIKKYLCDTCSKGFVTKGDLNKHMRKHTGKQFSCRHCVFTTPLREYLASHVRQLHMTSRHYQCETCGQTFRSHGNLAAHTRIHVGNYRFHCDRCPSKFTDQSNFLQHQRRHEGIKLHVCDHCGKSFVTSSDMRKHVRTHTGEHPFTCDQCGRTFKDGSSWKRHVKLHETDKNVFVCSLCRKRYSRIDLCNQHIKKTHANEPPGSVTSLILDAKTASSFPSESQTRSKKQMRSAQSIPFDTNFSPRESSLRQTFKSLTEVASQRLIQENYETTLHPSAVTDFSQRPFSVQSMTSYPLVTSLASLQTQNIPVTVDPFIFHQPRRDNVISYFMSTPKT
ncbi:ZN141-like protein [Mya arenaria]|uniref:ZN141-like protein n=1 Tax=Mya arenaria TaxID=6604 RepID=A0ABY7E933_MYAAR|nr:ZN141-like protein [Mya arenaria]